MKTTKVGGATTLQTVQDYLINLANELSIYKPSVNVIGGATMRDGYIKTQFNIDGLSLTLIMK